MKINLYGVLLGVIFIIIGFLVKLFHSSDWLLGTLINVLCFGCVFFGLMVIGITFVGSEKD